jgi:hypothetical protein
MTQSIIKVFISAVLILVVSEISKRSSFLGGFFASLPLVSLLAFVWLWRDTRDAEQVARLSTSILWLVLPSLVLFLALPPLLVKWKLNFYPALGIAIALMLVAYGLMLLVLKRAGIQL